MYLRAYTVLLLIIYWNFFFLKRGRKRFKKIPNNLLFICEILHFYRIEGILYFIELWVKQTINSSNIANNLFYSPKFNLQTRIGNDCLILPCELRRSSGYGCSNKS